MERALKYAEKFKAEHPQLSEEVDDIVQLMRDEIEEGGSVYGEEESCIQAIDDLLTT